MKKIIKTFIFILLLVNLSSLGCQHTQAVTLDSNPPSPTPITNEDSSSDGNADQVVTEIAEDENNQEIEQIRQAVKDKVKEKIDQIINKPNQKLGWVGQITQIENGQVFISCLAQQIRTVTIDENITIINTRRQRIDADQLKIDQIILAMGYVDTEGNLQSKRIVVTNEPLENLKNTIILATVTDISQTTSIMTLVTKDRQVFQVKTDGSTKDIVKNQKIIAILKQEGQDSDNWQVVNFKVISSTPSPSPSPTPITTE